MSEAEFLKYVRDRMKTQFDVKRVILFGSRARGEATSESDFDILVIADTDVPFVKRQGMALTALGKHEYPVDLVVYTQSEADEAADILGSAVYWAEKEGKVFLALPSLA